jgi:glycosyltransferase involved in cell wall biosynthesis
MLDAARGLAAAPGTAAKPAGRKRVLLVSLFHPELVRGGAQQVTYELFEGLRERDDIEPFLLASVDQNYPALYKAGARITGFDGRRNEYLFLSREYDHWWHKIGAPLLIETFAEFLTEIAPDLVHIHHFLTFGIDIISLVRRVLPHARIVFTFHEFMTMCAADGHMVRRTDGSLCDTPGQVRCYQCFPDRSPEQFLMRKMWFQHHLAQADIFTCPGKFMLERFERWGLPAEKLRHVTNGQRNYAVGGKLPPASEARNRFGFFGQYVDVKGVQIILRAVERLRAEGFTGFKVELNGDNLRFASETLRKEMDAFLQAEALLPLHERIVFNNGSYHVDTLASRMARVDWCIVPSIWWESFGLVVSEAWMFGRPVICSNAGGLAERNEHDVFALQFQLGDPIALAETIRRACTEEGLWDRLRAALPAPPAREEMVTAYLEVYDDAASKAGGFAPSTPTGEAPAP